MRAGTPLLMKKRQSGGEGIPSDYLARYTFNDATGADEGGNYNLSVNGSPSVQTGVVGNCVKFNGSDTWFTGTVPIDSDTAFSLAFWTKRPDQSSGNKYMLRYLTGASGAGTEVFRFLMSYDAYDKFTAYFGGSTSGAVEFADNTWVHTAYVYDGSVISQYVNGSYDSQLSKAFAATTTGSLIVGAYTWAGSLVCCDYIDDLLIYNRELTTSEISDIAEYTG